MPVMASTNIRDPRLNAHKRPASRSPDGSISSAKRHAGNSQISDSLALAGSLRNGMASTAPMSPAANELSAAATVEKFFDATIQAAQLRMELKSAHSERDKTSREFQTFQPNFSRFPAIKEQKTAAKTRALQKVSRIQQQIDDSLPEQKQVFSSLANLLDYSKAESSLALEVQSLKTQVGELQSTLVDYSDLRKRVEVVEDVVKDFVESYSVSEIPTRLKKLEGASQQAQADPPRLRTVPEDLETKEELPAMGSRIGRLETEMSSLTNAMSDIRRQTEAKSLAASTEIVSHLTSMESRVKQIEDDSSSDKDYIVEYVDQEIATLRGVVDDSKAVVKKEVSEELIATKSVLRQEFENELVAIRTQFAAGSKVQHQNAAAINNCLERLGKIEAADSPSYQTLSSLQGRVQKLEDEKISGATRSTPARNGSVWQPVMPDNEDEGSAGLQVNGTGAAGEDRQNREVEMLKRTVAQITTRINNLTTDDVVRQMVDQMSAMYPDSRNFQRAIMDVQRTANDLRASMQAADERYASLDEVVTKKIVPDMSLINKRLGDPQAKVPEDVGKLQADISRLTEQHDAALKEFQTLSQTTSRLAADTDILLERSQQIEENMKTVELLQTQLLKLEESLSHLKDELDARQPHTQPGEPDTQQDTP